jgi:phytoene dehydrogenase-like protein
MSDDSFDCVIIGAGMSGLAAGIRLAMYNNKVCILESHSIEGGLNSYYQRKGFKLDVGLHALTNFAPKGNKKGPLGKLLKQLRIPYDLFHLKQQIQSRVAFADCSLKFTNELDILISEVEENFPSEKENFLRLVKHIQDFNELDYDNKYISAKEVVSNFIKDPLLNEMIFCPVLIYGSAWENDMDFSQFVIMFKSIFLEGFSRPQGGVRTILNLLLERFKELGGEIRFRSAVEEIKVEGNKAIGVILKSGHFIRTNKILSSAGLVETQSLLGRENNPEHVGKMAFTESIVLLDKKPCEFGVEDTIIFYNQGTKYNYSCPSTLYDKSSAVLCLSNNFLEDDEQQGIYRVTNMANFEMWNQLERAHYREEKNKVLLNAKDTIKRFIPLFEGKELLNDVFTPKTVKRFTRHENGCVYGSPVKIKNGKTDIDNLFLCGTDQGFLGVVGAMLSGISMANLHVLMGGR